MTNLDKWMAEREKKDKELYEKFGRHLEKKHKGKIAAIGPEGDVILGDNDIKVIEKAIKKFGSGNFSFSRVGYSYFGRI